MKLAHLRVVGLEVDEEGNPVIIVEWHETLYMLDFDVTSSTVNLLDMRTGKPTGQAVPIKYADCMYNKQNVAYASVPQILSMIKTDDEHKRIKFELSHQ